jgi:CBS domain-containing protein
MAQIMVENRSRCLPVVDEAEKIIGVVDEEDLVHQDAKIHFPTFIHFLESYIMLPSSLNRFERELRQAVGSTARDVMEKEYHAVDPLDSVEEVATLMVDKDQSRYSKNPCEGLAGHGRREALAPHPRGSRPGEHPP